MKLKTGAPDVEPTPAKHVADTITPSCAERIVVFLNAHSFSVTIFALILILAFVFRDFVSLKKVFLYKDIGSDTINEFYPVLFHTNDYIHKFGMPGWSFNFGMGQNIFPFSLIHGPFDVPLFLADKDSLPYLLGYTEMLKILTGGMIFYLYLRLIKISPLASIAGSLMFSFSGFMILGGGWYLFSYEAVLIASLLLSFEMLFQQNSWFSFPLVMALIAISMPFYLYVYGVFILMYAGFRITTERGMIFSEFAAVFTKLFLLGFLGLGISSFFSFANVQALLDSPRGDGSSSYAAALQATSVFGWGDLHHNTTALLRFFSSDLLGSGSDFKGWYNYLEAPMFYCGLSSLLLFPSVFQFLDRKKTVIYGVFLALWILPVLFPYFRYAFWLFTGDYYRALSFFVSFVVLLFGLQALSEIIRTRRANLYVLFGTLLILAALLSYDYNSAVTLPAGYIDEELRRMIRVLLLVYSLLIYLICRTGLRFVAQILLLITLCFELGYFSFVTVNNRSVMTVAELNSKTGYKDYTVDAVEWLKAQDHSFYRIDKDYSSGPAIHASYNDALVQDYYGTSSYCSFNQKYYIRFLEALGIVRKGVEIDTRWATGLSRKPVAETVCSVKYFLTKSQTSHFAFEEIARFGDVRVLKNQSYLPLGHTYEAYISKREFDQLGDSQRDAIIMKAVFMEDNIASALGDLTKLAPKDLLPAYQPADFERDQKALSRDTLKVSRFAPDQIEGTIALDKLKLLFLSIPYDKGWTATVDGKAHEILIVNAGLSGLVLGKGVHSVKLEYNPPFLRVGTFCSVVSLLFYGMVMGRKRTCIKLQP